MKNLETQKCIKDTAVIVLFKSKIMESSTVTSLLNANLNNVQLKLIIWNNGPNLLKQEDVEHFEKACLAKGIYFDIYQDIRNISLSYLYNFCISKNQDVDFFTILDQDSILSSDFFSNLIKHASFDIICPQIFSMKVPNQQRWPRSFPSNTFLNEGEFNPNTFFTVGSGLSLSKRLLTKLTSTFSNVFCENYVLYHVDAELYTRIKKLTHVSGYCSGMMLHAESGSLKKASEINKLEWGLMKIIFKAKTKKKNVIQNIFYAFWHAIKTKSRFSSLIILLKCAWTKTHPRAKYKISNDFFPDYSDNNLTR